MKLSRIINSSNDVPEELRDYYKADEEGRLSLQVSGMVPKKKLKEFRQNNIDLIKKYNDIKEAFENKEQEAQALEAELESARKEIQKATSIVRKTTGYNYLSRVVNGFKANAFLIKRRKEEGCLTVEMEAAGMMAVSQFRNVPFGQILYAGDDLSGLEWDNRGWQSRSDIREQLFWLAAEAVMSLE